MGDPRGFLEHGRVDFRKRDPDERRTDYKQFQFVQPDSVLQDQGARCMDCGVPFCHNGCPLGNLIPEWNHLVHEGRWREALDQLHRTNNFPELTGGVCPAPCESACVLDINDDAVTIKQIELAIIEKGFAEGWVVPDPPAERTGMSVAIIGSGPAGLACAQQLNRAGHHVVVYERDESAGGMCRYGVPDAKLPKTVIDRRMAVLEAEGIEVRYNVEVGADVDARTLQDEHDAVVLALGARAEREMPISGRELDGVHAAMDYLYIRNRAVAEMEGRVARDPEVPITAVGKRVVVLGGGDTGMDCVSNANREGAADVVLLDTYDVPGPDGRFESTPWPMQPHRTPTTYALEEGPGRENRKIVTEFLGEGGRVRGVRGAEMRGRARDPELVPGTEFELPADLVLIAIGFDGPEQEGTIAQLGLETDRRTNVKASMFKTSVDGVYACGDARVGATLIVTAIDEGRRCARVVNRDLTGHKFLAADPDTGAPPPRTVRSEPLDVEVV